MKATQTILPFPHTRQMSRGSNVDLVGRSYIDEYVEVTVIGICEENDQRVLVRRTPGQISSMPGWLMRLIFSDKKTRRAA